MSSFGQISKMWSTVAYSLAAYFLMYLLRGRTVNLCPILIVFILIFILVLCDCYVQ